MVNTSRKLLNYQNGKIYEIRSDSHGGRYIGSTAKKYLSQRMDTHRSNYKGYISGAKKYMSSFEVLKYPDAKIFLLESFPCQSKDELRAREQEWIDANDDAVNKNNSFGKNAMKAKLQRAQHYQSQKEERHIKNKLTMDCECGQTVTIINKARHLKSTQHINYINSLEN